MTHTIVKDSYLLLDTRTHVLGLQMRPLQPLQFAGRALCFSPEWLTALQSCVPLVTLTALPEAHQHNWLPSTSIVAQGVQTDDNCCSRVTSTS